jgi:hypothetical protein
MKLHLHFNVLFVYVSLTPTTRYEIRNVYNSVKTNIHVIMIKFHLNY